MIRKIFGKKEVFYSAETSAGVDYDLSNTIADYWSNFVKNGNPNGQKLPPRIPFAKGTPASMELGLETGMKTIPENKVQAFQQDFIFGKL